jgi:hypothetical protein
MIVSQTLVGYVMITLIVLMVPMKKDVQILQHLVLV